MKNTDFTEPLPYPVAMKDRMSQWEAEGYFVPLYVTSARETIDDILERTPDWLKNSYPKYKAIETATAYCQDVVYVAVKCEKKRKMNKKKVEMQ